jgi:hypothetical protein
MFESEGKLGPWPIREKRMLGEQEQEIDLQRKSLWRIGGSKMRLFIASTLTRFATETGMASEILSGCDRL